MVKAKRLLSLLFVFGLSISMAQPQGYELDLSVQTRGPLHKTQLQAHLQDLDPEIRFLNCAGQTAMDDQVLGFITGQKVPNLNRLNLGGTGVTDAGVQALLNSTTVGVAGTIMGQPVLTMNINAASTTVNITTFFRKDVPMTLYKAVSPGTASLPTGAFVGERGLSYQEIQGVKQVKVTK